MGNWVLVFIVFLKILKELSHSSYMWQNISLSSWTILETYSQIRFRSESVELPLPWLHGVHRKLQKWMKAWDIQCRNKASLTTENCPSETALGMESCSLMNYWINNSDYHVFLANIQLKHHFTEQTSAFIIKWMIFFALWLITFALWKQTHLWISYAIEAKWGNRADKSKDFKLKQEFLSQS